MSLAERLFSECHEFRSGRYLLSHTGRGDEWHAMTRRLGADFDYLRINGGVGVAIAFPSIEEAMAAVDEWLEAEAKS